MVPDEIEQYLDADSFQLGYSEKQPPLFTWILYLLFSIFGKSQFVLFVLIHSMIFGFYAINYLIAKEVLPQSKAILSTFALLLIPVYSIEFPKYFTHSILFSLMGSLALYICLRILKTSLPSESNPKEASNLTIKQRNLQLLNYLLLGIVLGLGVLAKYNFVLVIGVLLLAALLSKESRKLILSPQIVLSFGAFIAVIAPHFMWAISRYLNNTEGDGLSNALSRGDAGNLDFWSMQTLKNLGNIYGPILFFAAIFLIVFFRNINIRTKLQKNFINIYSLLCLLMPLSIIIILQLNYFSSRWTSIIYVPIIITLFSFLCFEGSKATNKQGNLIQANFKAKISTWQIYLFLACCIAMPLGFLTIKARKCFFPDSVKGISKLNKPYNKIYNQFEKLCEEATSLKKDKCLIVSYRSSKILGNFLVQKGSVPVISFAEFKENLNQNKEQYSNTNIYFVYSDREKAPAAIEELDSVEVSPKGKLKALYKYSKKSKMKLFYYGVLVRD